MRKKSATVSFIYFNRSSLAIASTSCRSSEFCDEVDHQVHNKKKHLIMIPQNRLNENFAIKHVRHSNVIVHDKRKRKLIKFTFQFSQA